MEGQSAAALLSDDVCETLLRQSAVIFVSASFTKDIANLIWPRLKMAMPLEQIASWPRCASSKRKPGFRASSFVSGELRTEVLHACCARSALLGVG